MSEGARSRPQSGPDERDAEIAPPAADPFERRLKELEGKLDDPVWLAAYLAQLLAQRARAEAVAS